MDVLILSAGKPHEVSPAHLWNEIEGDVRNWQQNFFQSIKKRALFVVGAQENLSNPDFKFIINEIAKNSGSAESLIQAVGSGLLDDTFFACYGDVLCDSRLFSLLEAQEGDAIFAVDFASMQRNTSAEIGISREAALFDEGGLRSIRKIEPLESTHTQLIAGEFVGVVLLRKRAKNWLESISRNNLDRIAHLKTSVSEILYSMMRDGLRVESVLATNLWAELRDSREISRFFLRGKSGSLKRVSQHLRLSQVPKFVTLSRNDWIKSSSHCLTLAKDLGQGSLVVIRSSSSKEDGFQTSNAGAFESVLNVNSSDEDELYKGIERVFSSLPGDDEDGEVIVQIQVTDISLSGVVFTRALSTGSPYMFISYDDETGTSDAVTSGRRANIKTTVIARNVAPNIEVPDEVRHVYSAAQEIEKLVGFDALDIEFAVDSNGVIWTLQVRPLVLSKNPSETGDNEIFNSITAATELYDSHTSRLTRSVPPLYGFMPDWNPAEIIGVKPKPLSVGLYKRLITDRVWAAARHQDGYRDLRGIDLMVILGGTPYVDVKASFFSFIPRSITNELSNKFVSAAVKRLAKDPRKHDKVEFEVIPTCFSLDINSWFEKLSEEGFHKQEIEILLDALKELTNAAIDSTPELFQDLENLENTIDNWVPSKDGLRDFLELVQLCSSGPTLNFARLARRGFIAASFLKTSVENDVISERERLLFLQSIQTVSSRFSSDVKKVASGIIDFSQLIEEYGHLRPGTYDITKNSYREDPFEILVPLVKSSRPQQIESNFLQHSADYKVPRQVSKALFELGIEISPEKLGRFLREAIVGREESKFIFTKYLSTALSRLREWGLQNKLDSESLAFLDLSWIEQLHPVKEWPEQIRKNRLTFSHEVLIEPPPLIFSREDFQVFSALQATPNFVGSKPASAQGFLLGGDVRPESLKGKIVIIESADPGYEWIFGSEIKGLVTKFGGGNSHMAVRCSELGIPAAIGVGSELFRRASNAVRVILDPLNRKIEFEQT